ncbi:MAG: hypothetical protein HQ579_05990 [Candidatus Omnitrophica bacterium]|nr:hypothetical protein [Candidatus Omnitrophota bacterium]
MRGNKLKKFLLSACIIALLSFLYVHQQVESLKVGYSIQSNQKTHSYFLDQRGRLVYNLSKLKSPQELDKRLHAEAVELVASDSNHIYYASARTVTSQNPAMVDRRGRIIDKILDTFTERAEARTTTSQNAPR